MKDPINTKATKNPAQSQGIVILHVTQEYSTISIAAALVLAETSRETRKQKNDYGKKAQPVGYKK